MIKVITFGTYDVFHVGHLRLLERAKSLGDSLIVGVSTDELNSQKKNKKTVYTESERKEIISSLTCVSEVFSEESLELKREYILKYKADILVMGDDWKGKFDNFSDICKVIYFDRTPAISTTEIIEKIRL